MKPSEDLEYRSVPGKPHSKRLVESLDALPDITDNPVYQAVALVFFLQLGTLISVGVLALVVAFR